MNLYRVYPKDGNWSCFCFADTRNRAKTLVAHEFDDTDYIDLRCEKKASGVEGVYEAAIPDDGHELYVKILRYGCEYLEEG